MVTRRYIYLIPVDLSYTIVKALTFFAHQILGDQFLRLKVDCMTTVRDTINVLFKIEVSVWNIYLNIIGSTYNV